MSLLSEYVEFQNGKKRPEKGGKYPVYGGNGILDYASDFNMDGGVIIGRVGAYCGSAYLETGKCWVSDNAIKAASKGNIDIFYLYYLLKSLNLNEFKIGTSQPLLTQGILNNLEAEIPPMAIQKKVGRFLNAIDGKIAINARINGNLQQQMQCVYEHCFVENANPNWKQGAISDLGAVIGGGTPSKAHKEYYAENGIPWITPKDLSNDKSKFIYHGANDITELGLKNSAATMLPKGTVLFSSRAPIGYIAVAGCPITTNQGFKSVAPKKSVGTAYIYCFLKANLHIIEQMASGSTFKEISGSVMKSVPATIPDKESLYKFNEFCAPLFHQQQVLELQNQSLGKIRDILSPLLLSGELDVSGLDL
ncbi:MAG: restriction endonuclease subunit S [Oscillospiraceae bacterium]|nr:restriction endonuclease subunit S [Oscillospiraceae bacterium]